MSDEEGETTRLSLVDGGFPVLSSKCPTCIYRPGNKMHLNPGRREQMERDADLGGGTIICHDTLVIGRFGTEATPATCRGFYDTRRGTNPTLSVWERLGLPFAFVDLPEEQ